MSSKYTSPIHHPLGSSDVLTDQNRSFRRDKFLDQLSRVSESSKPNIGFETQGSYVYSNKTTSAGSPFTEIEYLNHRRDLIDAYIEDLDIKRMQLFMNLKNETKGRLLDMDSKARVTKGKDRDGIFNEKKEILIKYLDDLKKNNSRSGSRYRNTSEDRFTAPYSETKSFKNRSQTPDGRLRAKGSMTPAE